MRNVALLPPGAAKTTLMTFGVQGWACMPLMMPGRARGILGFDTIWPAWRVFFPLPVVRLAGDAIGNAIERELFERDRAKLAARLERALRMQMVGQLASGIAHNFNNIIGAILGFSEMAAAEIEGGAKAARHLAEIQRAAERGRDLIDSILTFGRRSDARTSSRVGAGPARRDGVAPPRHAAGGGRARGVGRSVRSRGVRRGGAGAADHSQPVQERRARRWTGPAASPSWRKHKVRTEGPSKVYVRGCDSGRKIELHFCPDCGSTVFWRPEFVPDLIGIAFGAFADPSMPWPALSVWETTRHPWVTFDHEPDRYGRQELIEGPVKAAISAPPLASH